MLVSKIHREGKIRRTKQKQTTINRKEEKDKLDQTKQQGLHNNRFTREKEAKTTKEGNKESHGIKERQSYDTIS